MKKLLIFDLDGTILNTVDSLVVTICRTLEILGLPAITEEETRRFVGNGAFLLVKRALKAAGDEELTRLDEGMKVFMELFEDLCTYNVTPYENMEEILHELKNSGYTLAVLSNKPDKMAVKVVETAFGQNIFSVIAGQKEGVPKKPDPAGVVRIAGDLGIELSSVIYIGDSETDIETARNSGVPALIGSWGYRSREDLIDLSPDILIDDTKDLINSVYTLSER